jgi:hypothetical protein
LKNWIRAERTLLIEKFKRSQVVLKLAHQQHADSPIDDEHVKNLSELEMDAVDSDLAKFRMEWQELMDECTFQLHLSFQIWLFFILCPSHSNLFQAN